MLAVSTASGRAIPPGIALQVHTIAALDEIGRHVLLVL
jgi:hypothetical protein